MQRLAAAYYPALLAIARRELSRMGPAATLDTRAVLHEAFLRLVTQRRSEWSDQPQFLAAACGMMRRVLVDHVRRRRAHKRGHGEPSLALHASMALATDRDEQLVSLDEALGTLAAVAPRLAQVVECRYFGGLTEAETAQALAVTERTVRRDWVKARGWLQVVLTNSD